MMCPGERGASTMEREAIGGRRAFVTMTETRADVARATRSKPFGGIA